METWDIKRVHKDLYAPTSRDFSLVEVPELTYVMVDGAGDPNTSPAYAAAVQTLYTLSYAIRSICKAELGRLHIVSPLEALWWADDLNDFTAGNRESWRWTAMIAQPDWITAGIFEAARSRSRSKPGIDPDAVRLERYEEGLAAQFLHIGPYRDEAPTIARMHAEYIPGLDLRPRGKHHEIYLSDPRKSPPEKLRTIVRQPVARNS